MVSLLGPLSEVPFSVVEKLPHVLLWLCVVIMSENCTNISIYNDANAVCYGERQLETHQRVTGGLHCIILNYEAQLCYYKGNISSNSQAGQ